MLKYNLPEEEFEFKTATNGSSYYFLIKDVLEEIREKIKYTELTEEQMAAYEKIRNFIYETAEEKNISLEIG